MEAQDGGDVEGIQDIKEIHPIEEIEDLQEIEGLQDIEYVRHIQNTQRIENLQPHGSKDVQPKELVDVQETIGGQKTKKVLEIENENTQVIRELIIQWSEVLRMMTIRDIQEVQQAQVVPVVQGMQKIQKTQRDRETPSKWLPLFYFYILPLIGLD